MKKNIATVLTITNLRTNKQEQVTIRGSGQSVMNFIRKEYPILSKFVLDGFEIDRNFVPLNLSLYNRS